MLEFIQDYYAFIFLALLFTIGLYGMMVKQNLVKKALGMAIVQATVIMFWIVSAYKDGAGIPILDERYGVENPEMYINPLPHAMMLTAVVVAIITFGLSLALIIAIYREYNTLHEPELLDQMKDI